MSARSRVSVARVERAGEPSTPFTSAPDGGVQDASSGPEDMAPRELEEWVARSPWVDLQHSVGPYEALKLLLMLPVVVVKVALLLTCLLTAWAGVRLVLLGQKPGRGPLAPWQLAAVQAWVRLWARAVLFVSGFYRIEVVGWKNVAAAQACRAILCFNHPSYLDPVVMGWLFAPSGVAKAGAARLPFISSLGRALGFVFVARRGALDAANRYVLQTDPIEAIRDRAADPRYPLVMIAPEGTTKSQRCLLKFARGAFAPGRPVLPVLIDYRFRHHNPGWGLERTPLHIYRVLAQLVNHLRVEVLPPVHPMPAERQDPALYAARVRALMGRTLGAPLVEQSLGEVMALARRGVTTSLAGSRVVVPAAAERGVQKKTDS